MDIIFIADFFVENGILGGGELNNDEFIKIVSSEGNNVQKINSQHITLDVIKNNLDKTFIISNFLGLNEEAKREITANTTYGIYEHDHKYLKTRDPSGFENYTAPKEHVINWNFYQNAKGVFCQSELHASVAERNLNTGNIISLGGNLWSLEILEYIRELSKTNKENFYSIMESDITHKNTRGAIRWCKYKEKPYKLIRSNDYKSFLTMMAKNEGFVFFPETLETLSRVVVEARMLNCKVITHDKLGAAGEEWFKLKGPDLVDVMIDKRREIPRLVLETLAS